MYSLIKTPNLPQSKVKHCLIGEKYTQEIDELTKLGIECIPLKPNKMLDDEINSHADILCFSCGNGKIIADEHTIGEDEIKKLGITIDYEAGIKSPYPNDVKLNCALLNNKIICNQSLASAKILDFASQNNIEIINTKQGYSKCNICVITDNAVITEDEGITSLLNFCQIDVLLISKGDIYLSDKHYGFLGGASGRLSSNEIYFSGNLEEHTDYQRIMDFLNKYHIKPIYNKSHKLHDFGGFIALTEAF